MTRARALAADRPLDLPFPEDMHSVQVTLFEVVNALANKRIDTRYAGLLLYAMQLASVNLNNQHASQGMCQAVKPGEPMLALEFRDFEEKYHQPKGIDLEANPEVALQDAGVLPDDAPLDSPMDTRPVSPDSGVGVGPSPRRLSPETVNGPQLAASRAQKSPKKKRKHHHRRGERVPLPNGLWKVVDPDAPFRAHTSELTREDAQRWQQRVWAEMAAFVEHGGAPGWDKDSA